MTAPRQPKPASDLRSQPRRGGDVLRPSPEQLDSRSLAVLELLFQEPVLTTAHVRELAFPHGTAASRDELTRRTLRRLVRWGFLYPERRQVGQAGGGSRPATYALTTSGARVLAQREGREAGPRRRPADGSTALRAHQLATADLHVALVVAARAAAVPIRWSGEPGCWWEFVGSEGPERLKPDGYAELDLAGVTRLAWFEVDQGTQSVPKTIAAKARRYCRAALAKAQAKEPIPLVVFVVNGAVRRERISSQLLRWAGREGMGEPVAARLLHAVPLAGVAPLLLGEAE
ncbi:MAG TPA: replication-relaxation family protein [Solirubrobacterales bacterium]|nr:replication-relaxation family protein [Solirubrobacterales bacterium]